MAAPLDGEQALTARLPVAAASPGVCVANMVEALDEPLLRLIFHRLSGWEAARLTGVCRAWRAWIAADSDGWRQRFNRSFYNAKHGLTHKAKNVQRLFDEYQAEQGRYRHMNAVHPGLLQGRQPPWERLPELLHGHLLQFHMDVSPLYCGVPEEFQGGDSTFTSDAHDVAVFGVRHWWPRLPRVTNSFAHNSLPIGFQMKALIGTYLYGQFHSYGHAHDCRSKGQAAALRPWVVSHHSGRALSPPRRHPDAPPARLLVTGEPMELDIDLTLPPRGAPTAWFALYCAAATTALTGARCVVCQRHVSAGQVHPVLKAPMCEGRQCREVYPTVSLHAVLEDPKVPPAAAELLTMLARKQTRSAYRSQKKRSVRLVLRSSVQAAMMTRGGYDGDVKK
jgi:hypothetical protein